MSEKRSDERTETPLRIQMEDRAHLELTGSELHQLWLCAEVRHPDTSTVLGRTLAAIERAVGVEPIRSWGDGYKAARRAQLERVREFCLEHASARLELELNLSQKKALLKALKSPPLSAAVSAKICEDLRARVEQLALRPAGVYDPARPDERDVIAALGAA